MARFKVREEVLNVTLAALLDERGMISIPESIRAPAAGSRSRTLPDITVADLWGIRIIIEGRTETSPAVRIGLLRDARTRVEEGLSPICLAVLYPKRLAEIDSIPRLRRAMLSAKFKVRVCTEENDGAWTETTVDGLGDLLRRSYELLVTEDVVVRSVSELEAAIESTTQILSASHASAERVRTLIGIPEETIADTKSGRGNWE
jgi:hypothetical protein